MVKTAEPDDAIVSRLREGLERLGAVSRTDAWAATGPDGLNPTQAQVLLYLADRDAGGARVKDIAAHLMITQPTATDSIAALERKGLALRHADPADARATRVRLTPAGRESIAALRAAPSALADALSGIPAADQSHLLRVMIRLIRQLQIAGAMPVQRICVNCRHFRPNIHADAESPHHCAFVDAAFGSRDLRLDCGDHETADPALQSANWMAFDKGSVSLQAPD